jgi:predicted transcriptional regulator
VRTTTDLPPAVHRRARELAEERGQSLSAVIAELTARGLASLGQPTEVRIDVYTGLPSISLGRPLTSDEVAEALDDE